MIIFVMVEFHTFIDESADWSVKIQQMVRIVSLLIAHTVG